MKDENNKNKLNIKLSPEKAQGTYSNLALITHSSSEFILDFIRVMPGLPDAEVKSRIILTPEHAKRLLHALEENIRKYEQQLGTIKLPNLTPSPSSIPPINFGGSLGEA
ncbi:MAG: DUF3467 domain-containing protein [Mangrovibacterium sp.]